MGSYKWFALGVLANSTSAAPKTIKRNQPKAKLLCIYPSTKFLLKILKCKSASRIISQANLNIFNEKNDLRTFFLSSLDSDNIQRVYLKIRKRISPTRPTAKGTTNQSKFITANFEGTTLFGELHREY